MFPWEYARFKNSIQLAISPHKIFSAGELAKLTQLQDKFRGHPEYVELALDEQRLSFVRWLVDNGRISEELEKL